MKYLLLLSSLFLLQISFSQCDLATFSTMDTITCGDCVTLSAIGHGNGQVAFSEDFNSGSPVGWQFTQTVTINNNECGVPSPDGTDFMWMGDQSVNPRDMTTVPFDLTLGGVICFEMRYSIQGDAAPCEGPDEPDEGVHLQYSTDGGTTWIDIEYWDPNGGESSSPLTEWHEYCCAIPPGAQTGNTQIRWHQSDVSGAEYDHWGIDNVKITLNDPNYQIHWVHDGYSYPQGNGGGDDPTPVCPHQTTTYTAIIQDVTNPANQCQSSVTVVVKDPVFISHIEKDTTICAGSCVTLDGTAYQQLSPEQHPTYSNHEVSVVSGSSSSMNINVTGVNNPTLGASGSQIEKICIESFNFYGTSICTNFGGCNCAGGQTVSFGQSCTLDISSFTASLESPNGCGSIVLVPQGVAVGQNYTQVCFVPQGGQTIGAGFPASGDWNPTEPFSNLDGCDANGVWTLSFDSGSPLGFGAGGLNGWSITFNDPEVTRPVEYSWFPTTDMTNSNTLSPTVCPNQSTVYSLAMQDLNHCSADTATVSIQTQNCCNLHLDSTKTTNTSCNATDGTITIYISGQTTNVQYSIDNGVTFQSSNIFNNLPTGTYQIVVKDDADCPVNGTATITSANPPTISGINLTATGCTVDNGSITIQVAGNPTGMTYSIDNGATFQSGNTFSNLSAGSYQLIIKDANGCTADSSATIVTTASPTITAVSSTNSACDVDNGTISVTAQGGTGTLTYSNDNGQTTQSTGNFTNLAAGSYTVLITDANGCSADSVVLVQNDNAPIIDSVVTTAVTCTNQDGSIKIYATGGTGTLTYSIDGQNFQNNTTYTNLSAGNYVVTVKDDGGCQASQQAVIQPGEVPQLSVTPQMPDCGASNGEIAFSATNGEMPYTFTINGNIQATSPLTGLGAGNYQVIVSDNKGCSDTATIVLNTSNVPTITISGNQSICVGQSTTLTATGATTYSWSSGETSSTITIQPNTTTTYSVSGTDAAGCTGNDTVTVTVVPSPVSDFTALPDSGQVPLTVTLSNHSSNADNYSWNFGNGSTSTAENPSDITYNAPGNYVIVLIASNGMCSDSSSNMIHVDGFPPVEIHFPNVFTPNDDHSNDFYIPTIKYAKTIHIDIFNRWGDIVATLDTQNNKWDGTSHGKKASAGVYFYKYRITDYTDKVYEGQGFLHLIREK